jgi:hypothetical protein
VLELAGPDGRISFLDYMRFGVPLVLGTTVIGMALLLIEMHFRR